MADFSEFYAANRKLSKRGQTRARKFLKKVPRYGRILDVGSGNGVFSVAFHELRRDLSGIDLVDLNKPDLISSSSWKGEIYKEGFLEFQPEHTYDAIWANNSLFFLKKDDIAIVFDKLAKALATKGHIYFTMIKSGDAVLRGFSCQSETEIKSMLKDNGLVLQSMKIDEKADYGVGSDGAKRIMPTFRIRAQKIGALTNK